MTKRERAQVVELLRCAADVADPRRYEGINGLITATQQLGATIAIGRKARAAEWAVFPGPALTDEHYRERLLEAAARVEEGSWP